MIVIEILYLIVAAWLAVYGFNALYLTLLRKFHNNASPENIDIADINWPSVTVQLPIYNERYVVHRLIDAVCDLDYPMDKLEIQVLDDSTDTTSEIIAGIVGKKQSNGANIKHIQRPDRVAYKGGALSYGMNLIDSEYIAIFDADFIPEEDTLKAIIPHFIDQPSVGCIQARWGHVNPDTSWLTRSQAAGIDGHFLVQQETRSRERLLLNFNGTAGIWRRSCIESSGGWQGDTLTEDLDLSYRAQLAGWQIRYLPEVNVPGELPDQITAFKRQQFRWAKGSIQTARKIIGTLWRSNLPLKIKLTSTIHLTNYLVHPLILLNLLLTLPIIISQSQLLHIVPIFTIAAIGPIFMYWFSMEAGGKPRKNRVAQLGMLLITGMGLSLNNTRAVLEALIGVETSFLRTPKFNISGKDSSSKKSDYHLPLDGMIIFEILFALYSLGLFSFVLYAGVWRLILWLPLYIGGFSYIAGLGIYQTIKNRSGVKSVSISNSTWRKQNNLQVSENTFRSMSGD